ncbi:MAG: hemin ABC transporter substrate-binding protein [Gemmobacter sp.]
MSASDMTRRAALALLAAAGLSRVARAGDPARVIAAGGSAAEIVFALGAGERLIARDTTSSFPPEVLSLPDVGYVRALSPENLIALSPDLILAEHDAGPPEAIEALRRSGTALVVLPQALDAAGVQAKIEAVAAALDLPEAGAALSVRVAARLAEAQAAAQALPRVPRVMFILSMQGGRLLAAGTGTSAEAMIRLAGGANAVEGVQGYKPLTDEAAIAADPDIILVMDRGGDLAVTLADVQAHPALRLTQAGAAGRVIAMDGLYLLGFGPRTGDAALELALRFGGLLDQAERGGG